MDVFPCLVACNCSSNKTQDYQHIGGKVHKVTFSNTPGSWCGGVICFFWATLSCSFFFLLIESKTQGPWGRVVQNNWQLPFCSAKGKTFASLNCLFRLPHSQRGNPWVIKRGSSDSHDDMGLKCSSEVLWGKAHSFARGLQGAFRVISESKLQDSPVVLNSSVFLTEWPSLGIKSRFLAAVCQQQKYHLVCSHSH